MAAREHDRRAVERVQRQRDPGREGAVVPDRAAASRLVADDLDVLDVDRRIEDAALELARHAAAVEQRVQLRQRTVTAPRTSAPALRLLVPALGEPEAGLHRLGPVVVEASERADG